MKALNNSQQILSKEFQCKVSSSMTLMNAQCRSILEEHDINLIYLHAYLGCTIAWQYCFATIL
ncbi:CLUMA_CG001063, isoform A [Clunio marinus]|uniref:CLUMA_CG001063, isoform A n=1 Tax=Clunio marinus TaxID=568069 RepID=A0A1J1HGZ0_9DIPT|nr:CLUMA_CG001063, isoform A [Clunio marinus]